MLQYVLPIFYVNKFYTPLLAVKNKKRFKASDALYASVTPADLEKIIFLQTSPTNRSENFEVRVRLEPPFVSDFPLTGRRAPVDPSNTDLAGRKTSALQR